MCKGYTTFHTLQRLPSTPLILTEFCGGSHDYWGRVGLNAPGQAEAREGPGQGVGGTPPPSFPGVGGGEAHVISPHYHHGELMCGHERPECLHTGPAGRHMGCGVARLAFTNPSGLLMSREFGQSWGRPELRHAR